MRNIIIHLDSCEDFLVNDENAPFFRIPIEAIEEYGFEPQPFSKCELPKNFPNCCIPHKSLLKQLNDWFIKFPVCCDYHMDFAKNAWFKKTKFDYVVNRILLVDLYTISFIKENIKSENWYKEITDYIDYSMQSFGFHQIGNFKFKQILTNRLISEKIIPKYKKNQILRYLNKSEKNIGKDRDLNLLYLTFQKWLKTIPDLHHLTVFKEKYRNKVPLDLFSTNKQYNVYLELYTAKVRSEEELLECLINLTKELLKTVTSVDCKNSNDFNSKNYLIAEHKIKQDKLLEEFNLTEIKYVTIIRKWLKNEVVFLKKLDFMENKYKFKAQNLFINKSGVQNNQIGNYNSIYIEDKKLISEIWELFDILEGLQNDEIDRKISEVKVELEKPKPENKVVKMGLRFIEKLITEVSVKILSPNVIEQIHHVISYL